MNNSQLDHMFEAAFEAAAESHSHDDPTPDFRPSWLRVQQLLIKQRKRKSIRSRLSKLAVIAASLLLGAVIFGNTQIARAIEPIYATLKEYPSGMMGFFFGRAEDNDPTKAKTAPPPGYTEGLDIVEMNTNLHMATVTQAQASKLLSFRAPVFQFIPTGYSFYQAQIYFYDRKEQADQVIYTFTTEKEKAMSVIMQKMKPNTGLGTNNVAEGVTVEKIKLSNGPAILTSATNGSHSLETMKGDIHISMSGIVPANELIRMYEEMEN
jgi:hypothetical protein